MIIKSHYAAILLIGFTMGAVIVPKLAAQTRPPAYYITQIELTGDADQFLKGYGAQVGSTLEPFGGRFLVRGAKAMHLEGDPPRSRNAIIIFDTIDKARSWYNSADYQRLIPVRQNLARTNSYLVEGLAP